MKKSLYLGTCALALVTVSGIIEVRASASSIPPSTVQKIEQEVTVNSFSELSDALTNINITSIKVASNITFNDSILNIPQRPITIDGQNHELKLGNYHITGDTGNTSGILTVKNTNISNLNSSGNLVSDFFTTTDENWAIHISGGVDYSGERFLEVSNSAVTFSGKNNLHTAAENAWVRSVKFSADSEYLSTAATEGEYSAFYFNGDLVGGKAAGAVSVDPRAKVSIVISPNDDSNYYYPAFYDKIDRIDVNEGATLNISAAGHALQFIPRADFSEIPSVNIANQATLHLVSHGSGNYSTVSFQQPGSQLNANNGATLYVEGKSDHIIETAKDSSIHVSSANYDFRNSLINGTIFDSQDAHLRLSEVSLNVWGKTGGSYLGLPEYAWNTLSLSSTIDGNVSFNTTSTNSEAENIFQTSNYGRMSGNKEIETIAPPVLNPINDTDTQLTGTGIPGDTVIITIGGEEIGRAVVGEDGRWVLSLDTPLTAGTVVDATQTDGNLVSDADQQTVTHLAAETTNSFNLGYWQDYGMILEGQMDNSDWNLSDSTTLNKTMKLVDSNNSVALSVGMANTNWYGSLDKYNGFQAILTNEDLSALADGTYKVQIETKGTDFDVTQDMHSVASSKTTPYRNKFEEIDPQTVNGKLITTSVADGLCYITIAQTK